MASLSSSTATADTSMTEARDTTVPPSIDALYRAHRRDVYRWASALAGPGLDAADLMQEVFLVVHRNLQRYDGRDAAAWLYGITAQVTRSARRRAWVRRMLTGRAEDIEAAADSAPTPEVEVERRARQRMFHELVAGMSEKRRSVFLLFEIGGYGCEEIARLEGLPAATVRSRLLAARRDFLARGRKLRRRLESRGPAAGGR